MTVLPTQPYPTSTDLRGDTLAFSWMDAPGPRCSTNFGQRDRRLQIWQVGVATRRRTLIEQSCSLDPIAGFASVSLGPGRLSYRGSEVDGSTVRTLIRRRTGERTETARLDANLTGIAVDGEAVFAVRTPLSEDTFEIVALDPPALE